MTARECTSTSPTRGAAECLGRDDVIGPPLPPPLLPPDIIAFRLPNDISIAPVHPDVIRWRATACSAHAATRASAQLYQWARKVISMVQTCLTRRSARCIIEEHNRPGDGALLQGAPLKLNDGGRAS